MTKMMHMVGCNDRGSAYRHDHDSLLSSVVGNYVHSVLPPLFTCSNSFYLLFVFLFSMVLGWPSTGVLMNTG
jgi:hypothetical protein